MPTSRVAELKAAAGELAAVTTTADAVSVLFDRVLGAVGAASGALWLVNESDGSLHWAGGAGIEASIPEAFQSIPLDAPVPGPEVVRTRQPITYSNVVERDSRWPALAGTPSRVHAVAALPVVGRETTLGVLGIGFAEERTFDDAELLFLGAVADQVAIALDRSKLIAAERDARNLLEFLADVTRTLSATLEPQQVLRELCRLTVPRLADAAAVYVPRDGQLHRIEQVVDARPDLAPRLIERFPIDAAAETPVAVAARTQSVQRVPAVTAEIVTATHADPEYAELVDELDLRRGLAVPVVPPASRTTQAVLTLWFTNDERTYTPQLTTAIEEVAARAGVALDTASRFQRERRTATTLTEAVLPSIEAPITHFDVAARYAPVDIADGDVGGDWFDAWELPDGSLMVGIGDVAGHGLDAATTMAMLRHAARAVALDDPEPSRVLSRLNKLLVAHSGGVELATSLYARIAPNGAITWASAGHPYPVLATSATAHVAGGASSMPLGVAAEETFVSNSGSLAPGALLVMATDGLLESKHVPIDVGIERLVQVAQRLVTEPDLAESCDALINHCIGDRERTDDCCVVLVRHK